MNIVIITADENLYLPSFFTRLLSRYDDIQAIYYTPPGHGKDKSRWGLVKKYYKSFGLLNLLNLLLRIVYVKILNKLKLGSKAKGYSISGVASSYGIHCEYIENINDSKFLNKLRDINVDIVISVSCPQIFKKELIELPLRGCLNIHGAPLPKYRGLLPSFWMMANGENEAAVTVFLMNEGIDSGNVITVEYFEILKKESLHNFLLRSKKIHCDALLKSIEKLMSDNLETKPLDLENGSYFSFPTREDYMKFKKNGRKLW